MLERPKSARRATVDARPGYRNGYGRPRRLSLTSGTIVVRRPRVRGLNEQFESRGLPLFKRRAYGLRDEEYLRLKILTCMLLEI